MLDKAGWIYGTLILILLTKLGRFQEKSEAYFLRYINGFTIFAQRFFKIRSSIFASLLEPVYCEEQRESPRFLSLSGCGWKL